ncbi:MAG: hypothetical protein FJ240_02945 [Nitrospira sp.]|nr:hypothetical protein [Nitrospira sp.]
MNINIPLIIPCFNQLTYLRNLINWFRYYHPKNDIFVLDNASSYAPLLEYLSSVYEKDNIYVFRFGHNEGMRNLSWLVHEQIEKKYEYYIVSDPDIMPHPSTPMNFLEVYKFCIDNLGYHHAGFCLKIDDLPIYIEDREKIIQHESQFWQNPVQIMYEGLNYQAYNAPIDTTFALYKNSRLWTGNKAFTDWENSLRMFEAFHLGWYIDPNNINEEMDYYFRTACYGTSADKRRLSNTNRPKKYSKNT